MMLAKDYRHAAWEKLSGKWGTVVLAFFLSSLILSAASAFSMFIPYLSWLPGLILAGPFTASLTYFSIAVMRSKKVEVENMFIGFKDFSRTFLLNLLISLFTFLWTLLFIIPGIVMGYAYSMSYYILIDHPEMSANEARKASIELMRGNKWRLFCLQFSFIGWWLLSLLTFGILSYWVIPYEQTAEAAFYQDLISRSGAVPSAPSGYQDQGGSYGGGGYQDQGGYQGQAPQGTSQGEIGGTYGAPQTPPSNRKGDDL